MQNSAEWSREFDLLWNNIMSDMAPDLNFYEKSLFLTEAQLEVVIRLYKGESLGDGFEASELNRRYLANLIKRFNTNPTTYARNGNFKEYTINLPPRLQVLLSEHAVIKNSKCCGNNKKVNVVPTKYDELNKALENPFRMPNSYKVLRVDTSNTAPCIIIISKEVVSEYSCEYLMKPTPIILGDLPTGVSIDGFTNETNSVLDDSLHRIILKYAVQLAAASWASNNKS